MFFQWCQLGVTKSSLCNRNVILKRQQNQMPSIKRQTLKLTFPVSVTQNMTEAFDV